MSLQQVCDQNDLSATKFTACDGLREDQTSLIFAQVASSSAIVDLNIIQSERFI
jgi:hypothetical protein